MNHPDVMRKLLAAGLIACALAPAAVVSAQSLGDVAKREEDRRKAVKSPGKVCTNGSLRPERAPARPAEPAAAPAPAAPPAPSAPAVASPASPPAAGTPAAAGGAA